MFGYLGYLPDIELLNYLLVTWCLKEGEFKVPDAPVRRDKQGNKIDKMLEEAKDSAENEEERIKLEKFMMYSKGWVRSLRKW